MVCRRISLAIGVALCVVLSGCGGSQEEAPAVDAVETSAPPAAEELPIEAAAPAEETPPAQDEEAAAESSAAVEFTPPFPDRVNLFQAPRRQNRGLARGKGQSDTTVELLGFVNVDGQRAVLLVDGLVVPVGEGDEEFGIEVISIQPPTVVLQRGRQRWQASLDN